MKSARRDVFAMSFVVIAFFGGANAYSEPSEQEQQAAKIITEEALRAHINFLSDDLLEGRGPGSRGDKITQQYIATYLRGLGYSPAAPNGSWFQSVPLVGVTTHQPETITFKKGAKSLVLKQHDDFVMTTGKPTKSSGFENAEIVFVGYGIVAPEYEWDDFKDEDVRGKVLLVMNNDPADDPELFAGNRRLYYGRWGYKYETAAAKGAAGVIIIHTTPSAGYPYQVVQTSWTGEQFELAGQQGPRSEMNGWVTEEAAKQLASLSGHDLDKLRASAEKRDFRPVSLGSTLSMELTCEVREIETANVLGKLPGSDPELSKEMLVFMAHHDHIGISPIRDERGDNIYNGAVDNASGTAAMLAIARATMHLPKRPKRTILIAAVGAEEQGLLGSKYLAANPPVPVGYLAGLINMDGINHIGPTRDINVIGLGKSEMDQLVQRNARWQKREVTPDQFPDRGYYYRSDQFSLAKVGVPGVYTHSGTQVIGKPAGWGKAQLDAWIENKYHQTSDEYREDWDLRGGVEDTRLMFFTGIQAANLPEMPAWTPGDEFEAARKKAIDER